MQHLQDSTLVPNHTLRHLIHQWLGNDREPDTSNLPDIDALALLKQTLQSKESTLHQKLLALDKLLDLSRKSSFSNPALLQLGFFPLILDLLFERLQLESSQFCVPVVERALLWALRWMSSGNEHESLKKLNEAPRIHALQVMFELGNLAIKESVCSLIKLVSPDPEMAAMVGSNQKLLEEIVHLLIHHNSRTSEAGIGAVSALSSLHINRQKLVGAGAVTGLLTFINNSQDGNAIPTALETMALLLREDGAKQTVADDPIGIPSLVKMVFRVSVHGGSRSAVECLTMICHDCLMSRRRAISAGILTQLLLLLQSQCNDRTKAEALKLLKLVRSKSADTNRRQ